MAQFSSVEQLMNMSNELKELKNSLGFSATLIGKSIQWDTATANDTESIIKSGVVESISMKSGQSFAVVKGEEISIGRILSVMNAPVLSPDESETAGNKMSGENNL